jgi:hypothetical protein
VHSPAGSPVSVRLLDSAFSILPLKSALDHLTARPRWSLDRPTSEAILLAVLLGVDVEHLNRTA